VQITLDTDNLTESDKLILAAVIGRVGLVSLPQEQPAEPEQTEDKPKRVRRTKAQMEADRLAEEAATPTGPAEEEPEDDFAPTEPTPAERAEAIADAVANEVTIEDLKSAASALIVKDREAAKRILGELGVSKVSEISEEDYTKAVYLFTAAAA
jgi:hypothetical protein